MTVCSWPVAVIGRFRQIPDGLSDSVHEVAAFETSKRLGPVHEVL